MVRGSPPRDDGRRPGRDHPPGSWSQRRDVVAAVDGSEPALVAARLAADEAARHGGKLHLVHAWLEPPMPADYPPDQDFLSSLELIHAQILRRAVDEVAAIHPHLAVTTELVHGPAASVVRSATAGRDLLVVGNHGLRDYSRQLLGLVSHAIVLNLAVPTIVVKHSA